MEVERGRPHAICLPAPAQGHINPMMKLANLLHSKGFFITFVNTEFNRKRLLRSGGPDSLKGSDDFRFDTIPDGLPPSDHEGNRDVQSLCDCMRNNCLVPFRDLLTKLCDRDDSSNAPPRVTLVVWDANMGFGRQAAAEFGIRDIMFWSASACGFMGYLQYPQLLEKGVVPFKDESCLSNGYLDTFVDWIPGTEQIRLKDLPTFIRITRADDFMFTFWRDEMQNTFKASAIIFNTFDELERDVLAAMASILPRTYTLGPLLMLCKQIPDTQTKSMASNMWKEDSSCIEWLDRRDPNSVVYVNFGSVTTMTIDKLIEFAWGLANSNQFFLWIVRPDLVSGESAILPEDFEIETKDRCLVVGWCPQEEVLMHPSIGAFLTHSGWNSTLEGICSGVPMICWPFYAEQTTNCYYACEKWGIGVEISNDVKREEVEGVIREVMEGEKGKEMRRNLVKWKEGAEKATKEGGTSFENMNQLFDELLSHNRV